MTLRFFGKIVLVATLLVIFFVVVRVFTVEDEEEVVYIAVVGPMTGLNPENGRAYREGVQLCLDKVNREGGINGRRVLLDVYDDRNDPLQAREKALEIIEQGRAVAVIGHNYSSCSISGGEVYKRYGIPAISPSSTAPSVTLDNDWYFRTVFNDHLEGSFVANYLRKVFLQDEVAIIHEEDVYGSELARIMVRECGKLGIEVVDKLSFEPRSEQLDERMSEIITSLRKGRYRGPIFLAMQAPEGVRLVKLLRDAAFENMIVAPNAFASKEFQEGFSSFKQEKVEPGYYSNGIFVTSPLLFDSADEEGQRFRNQYRAEHDMAEPDWRAAFAHDAARLVVEASRATEAEGDLEKIQGERRRIRDYLAGLTKIEDAMRGVTGYTYFDRNGDPQRPIFLGLYRDKNIISNLTQFQTIRSLRDIADIDEALESGRILPVNQTYMYRTNVVYTGVTVNEIGKLDIKNLSCELDLNLWFRYQGEIDIEDIVFLNAAGPVELGPPLKQQAANRLGYKLYNIKGSFRIDYLPSESLEEHTIGISFYHRGLTRSNLIYVTDILGMWLTSGRIFASKLRDDQVLSRSYGWRIKRARLFPDVIEKSPEGDPRYINLHLGALRHSRFNLGINIEKERFLLRRTLARATAVTLLGISLLVMLGSLVLSRKEVGRELSVVTWFLYVASGMVLVLSAETVLIHNLMGKVPRYYLELTTTIFDILWWLAPAYFLIHSIETFVWTPLERRASQAIPNIVRRFAAFVIYTSAIFGIIAFVFDQRITSLLATSGMIAMIIGLAIQINISNIFSGIALNLERPFKVGDWVKIGDMVESKVIDMTWRTTRLVTRDANVLSIPNSTAAEAEIINFNLPEDWYELWIYFHVDPSYKPDRVIKITLDALSSMEIVRKEPKPACRFIGYTEWSGEFVAIPVLTGYGPRNVQRGAVMTHLWTELHRAGIRQAIKVHEVHMLEGAKAGGERCASPEEILGSVDIFQSLAADAKRYLTEQMHEIRFAAGDTIVRQGDYGDSLFIIAEGTVGVWIQLASGESIEVDRMGAGTFFGEMALLTGEARTASVIAVTDTTVYKITKADVAPLIEAQPELSKILSEELTRRTINREAKKSSHEIRKTDEKALYMKIFHKLRTFFGEESG
jgi:branched-chain amino acid transport system substrate-binding protein